MSWVEVQNQIDDCRRCEQGPVPYLHVPLGAKRHPLYSPPNPTQILFVSVAPPWGGDYFWDESTADKMRQGLFEALLCVTGRKFTSVRDFHSAEYFLVPAAKCPSHKGNKDHAPHGMAIGNCAQHLRSEIQIAQPKRILALGLLAMKAVSKTFELNIPSRIEEICRRVWWVKTESSMIPIAGTYFPGNKRHQGFDRIPESISELLALEPKQSG